MKPGKLHNVRWLSLANRLLRLYVSTFNASKKLCDIVYFILNIYAPALFFLKQHWKCADGPKNHNYIASLICLIPSSVKDVIIPVFQRNAYFANPENILLSIIIDYSLAIREKAISLILKARAKKFNGHDSWISNTNLYISISTLFRIDRLG